MNIKALAEKLLNPANVVTGVKYYTARVSGRMDPSAPARQQIYLDALRTVPEISIHMGSFLLSEKFAGLVKPPEFRPRASLAPPWPDVVKVVKVEEKGSDVNLASHLLLDAFRVTLTSLPFSQMTAIWWSRYGSSRRLWASQSGCYRQYQTPRRN